ncbi:hypothetical protein DNTS_024013 [Danionella cerebrum]|uniref:Uncharacterized protein n=1 Tax=Danionella cerebrum TaxID=2873325 RepID=A0A553R274_9TELE|nr:hypothetical protein DNTS_024013 [Danionella translucida]TRY96283.1 hypothetical protein DNTS_024013 [Danionella translucida]
MEDHTTGPSMETVMVKIETSESSRDEEYEDQMKPEESATDQFEILLLENSTLEQPMGIHTKDTNVICSECGKSMRQTVMVKIETSESSRDEEYERVHLPCGTTTSTNLAVRTRLYGHSTFLP